MNVDDSVRMALSEATRPASVGSVSEVTAELGSLGGADASGGASIGSPPSSRPTMSPCFKCEYDVTEERYVIREPKVIVPGQDKPIEPEDPGELKKNRTYVCAVTRENNKAKAEIVEEDKVPDEALVSVPICKIDDSRGFDIITQYHVGAIVLGGTTFVGDMGGSEAIGGAGEEILVTGHPGEEGSSGNDSHSGIQFLTVSGRGDGGKKLPAKIIARIKNKDENEDWAAKTMTVPIPGGGTKIVHFLGCDDVDLTESEGGSDVEIKGGTGIKVAETKTGDKVTATVSNTGVIGLVGQDSSQAANGTITTKGATGSGLKVTVTRTAEPTEQAPLSNGTLEVDIDGRDKEDSFGPKELQLEGKKVATIFGTKKVNIKQKKIAAGTGVKVTEKDGVITVSATGANTSGFTGTRNVLADTQYSGHYLQKRFYTETWKDGVLESSTLGNWITYHTAVEETA